MSLFIGVDVGGTKVLAAAVSTSGRLVRTARRETPDRNVDPMVVEDALTDAVQAVAGSRRVDGVGIAAAGFVDAAGERVMFAPHLPFRGEEVRARLMERWDTTVMLDNDANCTARAEVTYGAARGATDAVVITLGTGIGGAVVIGGRVHRGRNGMAGEFGHMQVVPQGRECECGGIGCWEQYCSGKALARAARDRLGEAPTLLEQACDGDLDLLSGPMVTSAAEQGDPLALEAFDEVGSWLGVGTANLVAAFDPDVVVVGGGVSDAGDLLLGPARLALAQSLVGVGHRVVPPVLRATLGPSAGAVGAASMVRLAVQDHPRGFRTSSTRARLRAARATRATRSTTWRR